MESSRRERKVVSILFCDLVGFTSHAETLDPEDVDALLAPYHASVRAELERHGGTVEKFIGDAVVAFFGAPAAHEDDPERAVRAALAIRDVAEADGLELRVGVTTGEALIRLDAMEAGEGAAAGDVVNTASRLQSAAPVNGVLVDETTCRATRSVIEYRETAPVEAKGKANPVPVWEAVGVRARLGADIAHEARTELVGRERELSVLREAFDRARHEGVSQLVTLVGVPGLGKSRLVYELSRIADADPELVTWRQGRCLAYGDGVTLWALAEIVKAQTGIAEQDTADAVAAKLRAAVEEALAGSGDERWVEANLRPLVGLEDESELGGDRRGEAFSAWRRFLEGLADQRPLVLVFEDLHWADETLLDFVDELCDWVTEAPLFVVATARPELLERRPGWGGGKLNATTLALAPLDGDQTVRLIGLLLGEPLMSAGDQQKLLERSGGNPLYAEQFADLYAERGSTDELRVPETLQGLIAARIDGLTASEKMLLQDAAVMGKVFWANALRGSADEVRTALHALERKGFVRRQKRSSVEGQQELAFTHALVRDVSYGQIARPERSAKHRHAAEWIEDLGRIDDHAEMLAHHWQSALDLARAAGADSTELETPARVALRAAGDRASSLNAFEPAATYYEHALALWPEADPEHPKLLFRHAHALYLSTADGREQALEGARDALIAAGDRETAAEAEAYLSRVAWVVGSRSAAQAHLDRAEELVAGAGPSLSRAQVLSHSARLRYLAGDLDDAEPIAQEALALAEELELPELQAHALTTIGSLKDRRLPLSGRDDLTRALEIATAVNSRLVPNILNNLAVEANTDNVPRAGELYAEGVRTAERLGERDAARFMRGNLLLTDLESGRWGTLLDDAGHFLEECASSPHYQEGPVSGIRAYLRLARGDFDGARADWERSLALARDATDPQTVLPAIFQAARGHAIVGEEREARALALEGLEIARGQVDLADLASNLVGVARQLGLRDDVRDVIAQAPPSTWSEAGLAAAGGDFLRAAEIYQHTGALAIAAEARFRAGEELIEQGDRASGEEQLRRALAFYRPFEARYFVDRAGVLLAERESA